TNFPNFADKACTDYEVNDLGKSGDWACVGTGNSNSGGNNGNNGNNGNGNNNGNNPGNNNNGNNNGSNPSTGSHGTETEYGHCYQGDQDCAQEYKCNNPSGGATAYCIYRNPSDPNAYCTTVNNAHHCADTTSGCDQTNLRMGDNYSCSKAGLGKYCCNGPASGSSQPGSGSGSQPGTAPATSGCPGGPNTAYPKSTCQTSSSCPAGTHHQSAANDLACGTNMYCCIDDSYTGSTASIQSIPATTFCTSNSQCVTNHLGNACVFTNSKNAGVCMQY
ncbi:MAG: hypothetical protein ACM3IJ_00880, partial [Candidatus Levyibacteriota bacterium]